MDAGGIPSIRFFPKFHLPHRILIIMGNKKPTSPHRTKMISFRITIEQYTSLLDLSSGLALSDYIRDLILDENVPKRKTRGKQPVKDHTLLAKILGLLGRTRVYSNLNQLAKAANSGLVTLSPEQEISLLDACADIREIRALLMRALGKQGDKD